MSQEQEQRQQEKVKGGDALVNTSGELETPAGPELERNGGNQEGDVGPGENWQPESMDVVEGDEEAGFRTPPRMPPRENDGQDEKKEDWNGEEKEKAIFEKCWADYYEEVEQIRSFGVGGSLLAEMLGDHERKRDRIIRRELELLAGGNRLPAGNQAALEEELDTELRTELELLAGRNRLQAGNQAALEEELDTELGEEIFEERENIRGYTRQIHTPIGDAELKNLYKDIVRSFIVIADNRAGIGSDEETEADEIMKDELREYLNKWPNLEHQKHRRGILQAYEEECSDRFFAGGPITSDRKGALASLGRLGKQLMQINELRKVYVSEGVDIDLYKDRLDLIKILQGIGSISDQAVWEEGIEGIRKMGYSDGNSNSDSSAVHGVGGQFSGSSSPSSGSSAAAAYAGSSRSSGSSSSSFSSDVLPGLQASHSSELEKMRGRHKRELAEMDDRHAGADIPGGFMEHARIEQGRQRGALCRQHNKELKELQQVQATSMVQPWETSEGLTGTLNEPLSLEGLDSEFSLGTLDGFCGSSSSSGYPGMEGFLSTTSSSSSSEFGPSYTSSRSSSVGGSSSSSSSSVSEPSYTISRSSDGIMSSGYGPSFSSSSIFGRQPLNGLLYTRSSSSDGRKGSIFSSSSVGGSSSSSSSSVSGPSSDSSRSAGGSSSSSSGLLGKRRTTEEQAVTSTTSTEKADVSEEGSKRQRGPSPQ